MSTAVADRHRDRERERESHVTDGRCATVSRVINCYTKPLADPRRAGRGHGPLATWASAQNALKVAIFRLKIETFSTLPDPS